MNYKRWNRKTKASVLGLKLAEEAAEVGKEITDAKIRGKGVNVKALHEELDHVQHIVDTLRKKFPLPS